MLKAMHAVVELPTREHPWWVHTLTIITLPDPRVRLFPHPPKVPCPRPSFELAHKPRLGSRFYSLVSRIQISDRQPGNPVAEG
jgi:hypothetical protein